MILVTISSIIIISATQFIWIKSIYYKQQIDQLLKLGKGLSETIPLYELDSRILKNIFRNITRTHDVYITLLDKDGEILLQRPNIIRHQRRGRGTPKAAASILYKPVINLDKVLQGNVITITEELEWIDAKILSVAVPVFYEDKNEIHSILLLHLSVPTIDEKLAPLKYAIIYASIISLIAATVLSFLISRSLINPLLKINRAALNMAKGNYDNYVNINSNDELGMLADSFNILSSELSQKIKTLEKNNCMQREFLANISHELRTPLAIIQGYTEALQDKIIKDEKQQEEYINSIHSEVIRLKKMVNELLDLQKLETNKINLEISRFDIVKFTKEIASKIKTSLLSNKEIEILVKSNKNLILIDADKNRINQVLINLIDNAIKAIEKKGKIIIELNEKEDFVKLRITDTGCGIPKEELKNIWGRFYKVEKSRKRDSAGTGLGLAIVKEIIKLHGGTVNIASEPRKGTTFIINLPKNIRN